MANTFSHPGTQTLQVFLLPECEKSVVRSVIEKNEENKSG